MQTTATVNITVHNVRKVFCTVFGNKLSMLSTSYEVRLAVYGGRCVPWKSETRYVLTVFDQRKTWVPRGWRPTDGCVVFGWLASQPVPSQ